MGVSYAQLGRFPWNEIRMSFLLRIANYLNPKWWLKSFFPRDCQVEYQHEDQEEYKFDENESNSITNHPEQCLTQEMPYKGENPEDSHEYTSTDESCSLEENRGFVDVNVKATGTSPDDVGQSELHCQLEAVGLCDRTMPICDDSGSVSEVPNQDEETGRKDGIPVRTDLPSSDDVDKEEVGRESSAERNCSEDNSVVASESTLSTGLFARPVRDGVRSRKKRKACEPTTDNSVVVVLERPWKIKHPRRSVDCVDTTYSFVADSFTNKLVPATPPNTPIVHEVKSKAKTGGSLLEQPRKKQS